MAKITEESLRNLSFILKIPTNELIDFYLKEIKLFKLYFFIKILVSIFIIGVGIAPTIYMTHKINWDYIDHLGLVSIFYSSALLSLIGFTIFIYTIAVDTEKFIRTIKNPKYCALQELFSNINKI